MAAEKYAGMANIMIFQGDSTEILPILLQSIHEPVTFWLDAHYCGNHEGNTLLSAHNNKPNTPLLDELAIIGRHHIKTHTILIDDMGTFGGNDLEGMIRQINPDYRISYADGANKNDILIATI